MKTANIYPKPEKYRLKYAVKNEQGKLLWQIKDPCDQKKEFTFITDWGLFAAKCASICFLTITSTNSSLKTAGQNPGEG